MRAPFKAVAAIVALCGAASAHAQSSSGISSQASFSPQLFHPAPGPDDFVTIEAAQPLHHKQLGVGLSLDYARDPLSILTWSSRDQDPWGTKVQAQKNAVSGELWIGIGLIERLQIALSLPMTLYQNGQAFDGDYPPPDGVHVRPPNGFALGDPRLWLKALLYGKRRGAQIALSHWLSAPLGNDAALGGEPHWKGWAGEGKVIGQWVADRWQVGLNVGFHWRAQTSVYYSAGGAQALTYGGAAAYDVVRNRLRLAIELYGFHMFGTAIDYTARSPLELDVSARVFVGAGVSVLAGIGGGVLDGQGAPKPRVFVGLSWLLPQRDRDNDGVPDNVDKCPDVPEDRDGWEDEDGCPDFDDDHDTIRDENDKCPRQPEDFDGFQDEDGCPDPDNDHDGIPDINDACPNDPEDHIPPGITDGCPASKSDRDADGVPDSIDKCPTDPEDKDGFQDEDGCPDPDNDDDGIPDEFDQCPNAKEDFDNVDDEDGCPDFAGEFKLDNGELKMKTPIAIDGSGIRPSTAGIATIDKLAIVVLARPTLSIRVEGYWDKRGDAAVPASQSLADAVKRRLVEKGLTADRVTAVGYGFVGGGSKRIEIHAIKPVKPAAPESSPNQTEE